ncbi:hypothetical protein FHT00_001753 [Sphingomonas insulae]|uniref:Uncharacterized protein n=1 Tax=Sphingomonas insulae TaxID=424800 RepID=A0ABN1HXJ2_9SPHN|nr:5'-nucleotidase [Sphingomonas insulae]NIJ29806.1 hypothetical protein [Sphingomonas insulae]
MRLAMMMAMQAISGPPIPPELRPVKPTPVATPCGEPDAGGDIVVCARARGADRLGPIDTDRHAARPLRAETGLIGSIRMSAAAEQGTLPNGQSAPRAMLHLKMPF